jgi:hypothetical protein
MRNTTTATAVKKSKRMSPVPSDVTPRKRGNCFCYQFAAKQVAGKTMVSPSVLSMTCFILFLVA